MNGPQLDALVASAPDGVEFDGLSVSGEDPYTISVLDETVETDEEGARLADIVFAGPPPWLAEHV